ncbi:MAG: helix-turn-helix domain-containing protein [Candidatus Magasanikbacteria bacterium]
MNPQLYKQLQDVGLQDNEAKVYLALLEIGRGTVTQISSRAGMNRTTGYDILERLSLHGLVNPVITSKKKRIYVPEPPIRLKQFLENKKRQAERRLNEIGSLLPELQALYKTELKPVIKVAEGKNAMQKLYMNVTESNSTIYSILNLKGYAEAFDEMGTIQSEERFKKGIKEKCLAVDSEVARWWHDKTYKKQSKARQENTTYHWLPWDDRYKTAGEVNIFDDKVIGVLSKPEESIAFEIQSQTFADFLKLVFEMAWKNTKGKNSE